jgi:hypothetical protein
MQFSTNRNGAADSGADKDRDHVLAAGRFSHFDLPIQGGMHVVQGSDFTLAQVLEQFPE